MTSTGINYGELMQQALRGVMSDALSFVAANGLPGDHHFYITFDTRHPGVAMPSWLHAEHPEAITIVLQHEYANLEVLEDAFSVEMTFSDKPAKLVAPFDAVLTFVDPSVEFGLKFEATEIETDEEDDPAPEGGGDPDDERGSADVVSLDQFRKPQ